MDVIGSLQSVFVALPAVFEPTTFLYAVLGVALGIIWGALPALSSTMAMALLIGFSAGMPTHAAIVFLLGIYSGTVMGGSITAICTNIPGTPAATCTATEGYPLFRKGEGGTAIGTAIVASTFSNLFGAVVLILCAPYALDFALRIGSWETFLIGLWGVMISGSISGGPALKGWLAGLLGISLSFVGLDSVSGEARFTFGLPTLYGGVSFIAVLIGLFGFAEIARGLILEHDVKSERVNRVSIDWRIIWRNRGTLAGGSSIGTVIGMVPAAGADIAAFIAYSMSRRFGTAAQRREFGQGSYRGIIAAESSNSASVGGSLLPALVLAIPGSTVVAAFMGALNLHGINLGPMIGMSHPGLVQFMLAGLVVVSLLLGVLGIVIARPCVALLSIPRSILLPSIMPICILGAFAAQNNVTDIYIMLISGLVGLALVAGGFPLAPLVMGLILGPLVDTNFRRSMLIFRDQELSDVLMRPVGLVMLAIIALTFIGSLRPEKSPA